MTAKIDNITDKSNVVYFKNYVDKKKLKTKTSTIAAIIALKIDHPDNLNPEDFFIENIESNFDIEVLAFEDAIDSISENFSNSKNHNYFVNDAYYFLKVQGKFCDFQPIFSLSLKLPSKPSMML